MPPRVADMRQLWHPEFQRWVPCVVWAVDSDDGVRLEVLYPSGQSWISVRAVAATPENIEDNIWKWRDIE